jgi:hypothetical protein
VNHEGNASAKIPGFADIRGKRGRVAGESAEETYDPFWTNAFSFLRDLEENFAVSLATARLGSLVKFEGCLQFLDMRLMKTLWEPVAEALHQSETEAHSRPHPSRKQRRESKQPMPQATKLGLTVIKEMPHPFHMTFLARENDTIFRLWAAMKPEYLTISSDDLVMKFGAAIDGIWTVVGIVDARVGDSPAILETGNSLIDGIATALAGVRQVIGRPKDHWGVTPIAIYTPIRGSVETEVIEPNTNE